MAAKNPTSISGSLCPYNAPTLPQKLGYFVLWPVGKLQTFVLRLQDHWETLATIRSQPKLQLNVPRQSATLDWDNLLSKAIQEQEANANNNQFGIENARWLRDYQDAIPKQKGSRSDASWLKSLEASKEWTDLDLLARGLREMGAEPLFISMPIKGLYYDYVGVTAQARQRYYDKLHETLAGLTVIDHAQFDGDKTFLIDPGAHLSRKGWVYTDQELDAFFHNRLP
jgi:D-alanine transfer protein